MYTLLLKLFPEDIALMIYELNIKAYVSMRLVPRVFTLENIMFMIVNKYRNSHVVYNLLIDYQHINHICINLLKIYESPIYNKYYKFDSEFFDLFNCFNKTIKRTNDNQADDDKKKKIDDVLDKLSMITIG